MASQIMHRQTIRISNESAPRLTTRMRPQPPAGMRLQPSSLTIDGQSHFIWSGGGRVWGIGLPNFRGTKLTLLHPKITVQYPEQVDGVWHWVYSVETTFPKIEGAK